MRAILTGERDPVGLAKLRIRASEADIVKSQQGNWRAGRSRSSRPFACAMPTRRPWPSATRAWRRSWGAWPSTRPLRSNPTRGAGPAAKEGEVRPARRALIQACGVDLTRIDGIDVGTAFEVIAEVGPDLSRFKSVKHFASWLGLCAGTKMSGGKVLSGVSKRSANRLTRALRMAAGSLRHSQSARSGPCTPDPGVSAPTS